ncbi:MAG: hypothetical protein NVSMB64_30710 [Candidatus Velthaea sp.]
MVLSTNSIRENGKLINVKNTKTEIATNAGVSTICIQPTSCPAPPSEAATGNATPRNPSAGATKIKRQTSVGSNSGEIFTKSSPYRLIVRKFGGPTKTRTPLAVAGIKKMLTIDSDIAITDANKPGIKAGKYEPNSCWAY